MMKNKTRRLAIAYSLILLVPYVLSVFLIPSSRDHDVSLGRAICTGLLSIFGPWSTLVSKYTSIPHAGEFCDPWLTFIALCLTAGLITVIKISISTTKRWVTARCVGLYILIILVWMFFGMTLMSSYLK